MILHVNSYHNDSNLLSKTGNFYVVEASHLLEPGQNYHLFESQASVERLKILFFAMLDEIWMGASWSFSHLSEEGNKTLSKEDFYLEVESQFGVGISFWVASVNGNLRRYSRCPIGKSSHIFAFPKCFDQLNFEERSAFIQNVFDWCNQIGSQNIVNKYRPLIQKEQEKENNITQEYPQTITHLEPSELILN